MVRKGRLAGEITGHNETEELMSELKAQCDLAYLMILLCKSLGDTTFEMNIYYFT